MKIGLVIKLRKNKEGIQEARSKTEERQRNMTAKSLKFRINEGYHYTWIDPERISQPVLDDLRTQGYDVDVVHSLWTGKAKCVKIAWGPTAKLQ